MLVDDAPGPRTATPSFLGEAALAVLIWAKQRREAAIHAVCFMVEALEDFRARVWFQANFFVWGDPTTGTAASEAMPIMAVAAPTDQTATATATAIAVSATITLMNLPPMP